MPFLLLRHERLGQGTHFNPLAAGAGRPLCRLPAQHLRLSPNLWARSPRMVVIRTEEPRNINVLGETKRDVVSSALRRRVKVATDWSLRMTHRAEEKVPRCAFSPQFQTRGEVRR
jgi:hypothetical protein